MRFIWAVLASLVVLCAGCTSDKPSPNYSSVSTTPTSASPTPTQAPTTGIPTTGPNVQPGELPPSRSALGTQHSSDGALAFASDYYKMSDWLFASSDVQVLEPFFSPDCTQCAEAQSNLERLLAGGNHFVGGRITIKSASLVDNDGRRGAEFAVTGVFDVGAATVNRSDGSVAQSFPASTGFQLTDWLRWSGSSWQIVEERRA